MIKKYEWTKNEILEAEKEISSYPNTKNRPVRADRFLESRGAVRNWEDGNLTVIDVEKYEKFSALVEEVYKFWQKKEYAIKKRLEALNNQI